MRDSVSPSVRRALRTYEQRLREAFGQRLRDVRLFGSFARCEANEDSDIDVLVVVDALSASERARVSDLAAALTLETGLPLAPLPMSTDDFEVMRTSGRALADAIEKEGRRV